MQSPERLGYVEGLCWIVKRSREAGPKMYIFGGQRNFEEAVLPEKEQAKKEPTVWQGFMTWEGKVWAMGDLVASSWELRKPKWGNDMAHDLSRLWSYSTEGGSIATLENGEKSTIKKRKVLICAICPFSWVWILPPVPSQDPNITTYLWSTRKTCTQLHKPAHTWTVVFLCGANQMY